MRFAGKLRWLKPADLDGQLRKRVPLYTGRLPQTGNLQLAVRDALQAMLDDKKAIAKVEVVDTPSTDTAVETLHFHVATPLVFFDKIRLVGNHCGDSTRSSCRSRQSRRSTT